MRAPRFRRTLPMSSKVLFGVAAALALASFLAVRSEVARAAHAQRAAGPAGAVVVAAHDLFAGAVIGPADVRLAQIPVVYLPPHAVTSTAAAIGKVSASAVLSGEVLVDARLGTSAFAVSVATGDVAVTVGFASVPDGVSTADRVDAYATFAGARPYTTVVGEDLRIISIGAADRSAGASASVPVTLEVDPETARQLLQAAAAGTLGLAVRATATASPSPSATPVPGTTAPPG
jgi:Flp pilus assembly protein CpaB